MTSSGVGVIKKRTKYSKNGCQECKRMKVKCDEMKPICTRCSKTSKQCLYIPSNPKKSAAISKERTPMGNLPVDPTIPDSVSSKSSYNSSPLSLDSFNKLQNNFTKYDFIEMINEDITSKFDKAIDSSLKNIRFDENKSSSNLINQLDENILNNLEVLDGENSSSQDFVTTDTIYQIPLNLFSPLQDPQHKFYLEVFYKEFSQVILPMEPKPNLNPIRDILLQHCFRKNYLFYAILATGARFSFNKRLLEDDQKNYSIFMKKTLQMLDDLVYVKDFIPSDESSKAEMTKTVENLLLTILILTSDNASSMKQSWRGHLKGAKDLLHKIFILKRFNHNSKILIFCKLWFTSFEVLACLTAPRGGTISSELERKHLIFDGSNMDELKALQNLKLITREGFNLLLGYHDSILSSVVGLIDIMKLSNESSDIQDIEHITNSTLHLISEFKTNQHLSMLNHIPPSAISTYRNSSTGDVRTISWYDICHESHVDASLITIMIRLFSAPKTNHIIQGLVKKILSRLQVLGGDYQCLHTGDDGLLTHDSRKLFNLMLLQWPLLVAGLNSTDPQDKVNVENLFRLLQELGSGSSIFVLDKIKRCWNNEMNHNEVDIVTY